MIRLKKLISAVFSAYVLIFMSACTYVHDSFAQEQYDAQGDDASSSYSQAELDQILAPIALYPDTLLSHILIASTYPLEVVQAQRWSVENGQPKGDQALAAAENNDWDPSVIALTAFPELLERMGSDLNWLQTLGDAFLQDEELVLASVQDLRIRARDEGSLSDLDHIEVVEDDDDNIVIETRVKEVVYVPYYDTRVVYGPWWWSAHPPIFWRSNYWRAGLSFYWGPRIYVGSRLYFSSFHWHKRHVVVLDHRRYRNHVYSSRHVARHSHSRRWAHNVTHRRGVKYRHPTVRQRYDARHRYNQNEIHNRISNRRDTQSFERRTDRDNGNRNDRNRIERNRTDANRSGGDRVNLNREQDRLRTARGESNRTQNQSRETREIVRSDRSGDGNLRIRTESRARDTRQSDVRRDTRQREANVNRQSSNVTRSTASSQRAIPRTQRQSANQSRDRQSSNRIVSRSRSSDSSRSSRSSSSSSNRYARSSGSERSR